MRSRLSRGRVVPLALLLTFATAGVGLPAGLAMAGPDPSLSASVDPTDTALPTAAVSDSGLPTDPGSGTDSVLPTDPGSGTDSAGPTDPGSGTDSAGPTDPVLSSDSAGATDTGLPSSSVPASGDPGTVLSSGVTTPAYPPPTGPPGGGGSGGSGPPIVVGGSTGVPPLPGHHAKVKHPHKPITTVHRLHVPARPHPHRKPWPITLTIKTVPSLANVEFAFDGRWVTTDQYGVATVTEEHNLTQHSLRIGDLGQEDTGLKFRFTRWVGQRNQNEELLPTVTGLPMRADATIYAAVSVQYPAVPRVITQLDAPVRNSDITSITVRNSTGQVAVLRPGQQAWLDGIVPSFQRNVLYAQPIGYSVQSVVVHGSNVVDAGRQHFDVTKTSTPTLTALFFNLTVQGRDSLFGRPLGSRATIRYPDGTKLIVNLGSQHKAVVANLPRGKYQVTISAPGSIVSAAKVTLSRTMTFQARAVTVLDLLSVLVSAVLVALLLLVLGRTDWANRMLSRAVPRGRWARRRQVPGDPNSPLETLLR